MELIEQLMAQAGKHRSMGQGAYLFHQSDPICSIFIVENGLVELTRHQRNGTTISLQRAKCNTVLAEASVYSEHYHCDAVAKLPTRVFEIPKTIFLECLQADKEFSYQWAAHLAKEVQSTRYRCEILSRKTVAERLDGWLAGLGGDELPPKGQWKSIAAQIGVSPEALYRELAKRRPRGR